MKTDRKEIVHTMLMETTQSLLQTLSTSLGPCGLDKMLIKDKDALITNDGATILKFFNENPIHKILSAVSDAQDTNCGDGTTSVVLLTCTLIEQLLPLKSKISHHKSLNKGIEIAKKIALDYIEKIKIKVDPVNYIDVALTTLSSKISANNYKMGNVAIEALENSKIDEIKIIKRIGSIDEKDQRSSSSSSSVDDIQYYNSILLNKDFKLDQSEAKILILQFCLSPPKTNMDFNIEITNIKEMEDFVLEEKNYLLNKIKKIYETGANLLIIQKSLVRESVSDMALHFLEKFGIKVISNVDRSEIIYLSNKLQIKPISDIDLLNKPKTFKVSEIDEMLEIKDMGCTIVVSGCDQIVCDETERNLHDTLGVINCLKRDPYIVPGGCSVETGISNELNNYIGEYSTVVRQISESFISLPYFVASNIGHYSVDAVTSLKKLVTDHSNLGLSIKAKPVADMIVEDSIIQPAIVSSSVIVLAFETADMLLKIDDILPAHY